MTPKIISNSFIICPVRCLASDKEYIASTSYTLWYGFSRKNVSGNISRIQNRR